MIEKLSLYATAMHQESGEKEGQNRDPDHGYDVGTRVSEPTYGR